MGPGVDLALVGGGSILLFLLASLHTGSRPEKMFQDFAALLAWVVNWPHFAATSYRLYGSAANRRQYPWTAGAGPVLVLVCVVAALAAPEALAPPLVKLYLVWSSYHFSGQTVGVTLLYARRAGFAVSGMERRVLTWFVYGTFLGATARGEVGGQPARFLGVTYPTFGLPAWLGHGMYAGAYLLGVGFLVVAARWWWRGRGRLPWVIVVVPAAQFVWFLPGSYDATYYQFVPFFHALQYLFLAWALNLKEVQERGRVPPSEEFVLRNSLRWGGAVVVGGGVLFWILPRVAEALSGQALPVAEAVVLAGVQIHHFLVDGVIWRLRDPTVGAVLSVTYEDLVEAPVDVGTAA